MMARNRIPLFDAGPQVGLSNWRGKGRAQRDGFAGFLAVDEEVAVGGADGGIVVDFREAGDAGIGKVHGGVGVFFHSFADHRKFVAQGHDRQNPVHHKFDDAGSRDVFRETRWQVSVRTASQIIQGTRNPAKFSLAHG